MGENDQKTTNSVKDYNKVITAKAVTDAGLFKTHRVDDKLYYEIPDSLFGEDMLLVSRIAKMPNNFGGGYVNAGSKVNEQVVRWYKRGNQVDMKVVSFENQSDPESPINYSVEANNFFPILFSSKIAAYNKDSTAVVIEVDGLFEEDIQAISGISLELKKRYKVKNWTKTGPLSSRSNPFPKILKCST